MIEREAGDQRVADIKAARALVAKLTPAPRTIGVGVIGLGFMGRTHINAFAAANAAGFANKLVAVCDKSPERRAGRASAAGNIATGGAGEQLFDPREVRGYEDAAQLFADPAVELVSICTHTSTHVELAKAALEAGKHVLLEKPVALDSASIEQLLEVARRSKGLCMPAMCIRFWPAWAWLKRAIASGEYGAVKSAVFRRLGSRPQWAADFYANNTASGGALFDLHVHDVDFATWCLGAPRFVAAAGSEDHVSALYHYESGPQHVAVEGGWDHSAGLVVQDGLHRGLRTRDRGLRVRSRARARPRARRRLDARRPRHAQRLRRGSAPPAQRARERLAPTRCDARGRAPAHARDRSRTQEPRRAPTGDGAAVI